MTHRGMTQSELTQHNVAPREAQARAPATEPNSHAGPRPTASEPRKVDFCIVGSSMPARLVALKAAEAGASTLLVTSPTAATTPAGVFYAPLALVEAGKLIYAATSIDRLNLRDRDSLPATHGEELTAPRLSGEGLVRHLRLVGETLALRTDSKRLRALQVSILTEETRFEDTRTLRAGDHRIAARQFVLAPDLEWDIPGIPGIDEIDYLTPDRPIIASRPVERLVVIGMSDSGLALAQAHRHLGADVTLLPSPDDDSAAFDDEIIRLALAGLARDGVVIDPDARVTRIEARGREAVVHISGHNGPHHFEPSQVLLAPRLRARFTDPDWATARISTTNGQPVVNAALRTSNSRVSVIDATRAGDIFSFRLDDDADFLVDSLLRGRRQPSAPSIRAIPTTPAVAIVGASEAAARDAHGRIKVTRASHAHHLSRIARHRILSQPAGELKVIATRSGRIVGCAIAGDGALDVAGLWALAISRKLKLDDLARLSFPDIALNSLTRRATRLSIYGWPLAGSMLLRLARLWRRIRG